MPRRSQADLSTPRPPSNGKRPPITPTCPLTSSEKSLFTELLALNGHLGARDRALLTSYCQAVSKAQRKSGDVADWERCCRTMLALARSLRLTEQSIDRKFASRRIRDTQADLDALLSLNEEVMTDGDDERPWQWQGKRQDA
jgi:hypothetical protein